MINPERRNEAKRIDVSRLVELVKPGEDDLDPASGFTKDLSDSGIRAKFDTSLEPGANVLIRLYWEDEAEPIEKHGKIVWTSPDLYADGTEVGMRILGDMETESLDPMEPPQNMGNPPPAIPVESTGSVNISKGKSVKVDYDGISIETTVAAIGELNDNGEIKITLRMANDAIRQRAKDSTEQTPIDPEDWTPHPFKDAWNKIKPFAVPTFKFVYRILMMAIVIMIPAVRWLWSKIPSKITEPAKNLFKKIEEGLKIDVRRLYTGQ